MLFQALVLKAEQLSQETWLHSLKQAQLRCGGEFANTFPLLEHGHIV